MMHKHTSVYGMYVVCGAPVYFVYTVHRLMLHHQSLLGMFLFLVFRFYQKLKIHSTGSSNFKVNRFPQLGHWCCAFAVVLR
jgi:hypothetical protein